MCISKKVNFFGFIEKDDDILKITKRWLAAIALYKPSVTNPARYTEPGKIKFYFGYGLPIIMTNVAEISKEVLNLNAGVIVRFSVKSLSAGIDEIKKNRNLYVKGANIFINKYESNSYYKERFKFLESG